MKRPNFFIVGAPKCGTTSLSEYLRSHPNVFMSWPKEPHFFATDFHPYRKDAIRKEREYLQLFAAAEDHHHAIGEASVWYLYSETALRGIKQFAPQAGILVMLRNPIDYLHSLHAQMVYNLDEDVEDFEEAWGLQDQRLRGERVPRTCRTPFLLQYRRLAAFGTQLERVLSQFPKQQVHVIVFDDFVRDAQAAYRGVLQFLSLPDDHRNHFPRVNPRKRAHRWWLAYADQRSPEWMKRFVRKAKRHAGIEHTALLKPWYTRESLPVPLRPEFRAHLGTELRPEVEKVADLIGRDLGHWLKRG